MLSAICILGFSTNALAQSDESNPIGGSVDISGTVTDDGVAGWEMSGLSEFSATDTIKSTATVTVTEDASGVRSDAGNLRLDITLPGDVEWITGINLLTRDGLSSIDAQTGYRFERDQIGGEIYSVVEYLQQRVQVLTPSERDLIAALEDAGIPITDTYRNSLGRWTTQWNPHFKVGGGLSFSGINLLDGEAVLEGRGEYRSADQSADVSFTLRSVIPAEADDVDLDDILNPFEGRDNVLDGQFVPPVDGLWAWNLAYNSKGITDLTATLNSPEYSTNNIHASASVQQIAQWKETVIQSIQTTVGAKIQTNFSEDNSFSIEPTFEIDWITMDYAHGITGGVQYQFNEEVKIASQIGYRADGVELATTFARADVTFARDNYSLGAYVKGEYSFKDPSQLLGAGFNVEFEATEGAFEGIKAKLDGEFSRKFMIEKPDMAPVDDYRVSVSVHLPF